MVILEGPSARLGGSQGRGGVSGARDAGVKGKAGPPGTGAGGPRRGGRRQAKEPAAQEEMRFLARSRREGNAQIDFLARP